MRLSSPEDVPAMRPAMRGAALAEPVIATKLFVPALGTRSVQRPRLRNALDKARNARLALVVAPAGWGKSTLLAQWLCDGGVPCGWLSLDAADDDVTRFWRYLLVAVQQADAGVGSAALRRLDTAGVDVERDVLPVLVNELAGAGRDLLLVLDDYHLVRSRPVHRSVAGLLDHAPASLHLVISSRTDPPLPLSRLRVAGDLVEVRAEQLRFTAEEAASMLHRAAVSELSADEVQRLVDRTEGWAVGLQLAALRLADRADRQARVDFVERFTGADRHIVDYVGEEVLDALPSQLRDFLLQTSVLSRLSAPLANAVTEGTDAARMLAEIQRGNLFLTALDDEGRWYRYHQLFRDLLAFELQRSGLVEPTVLHRRGGRRVPAGGRMVPGARGAGRGRPACPFLRGPRLRRRADCARMASRVQPRASADRSGLVDRPASREAGRRPSPHRGPGLAVPGPWTARRRRCVTERSRRHGRRRRAPPGAPGAAHLQDGERAARRGVAGRGGGPPARPLPRHGPGPARRRLRGLAGRDGTGGRPAAPCRRPRRGDGQPAGTHLRPRRPGAAGHPDRGPAVGGDGAERGRLRGRGRAQRCAFRGDVPRTGCGPARGAAGQVGRRGGERHVGR